MTDRATIQRRRSAAWDVGVFQAPLFRPLQRFGALFFDCSEFPSVEQIDERLASFAHVRFVEQPHVGRRRKHTLVPYEEAIFGGEVPTRRGSHHDLMNALAWSAFPLTKRRLHALQRAEIQRARAQGQLGCRTKAHDALAVLDEGGLLIVSNASESAIRRWAIEADAPLDGGEIIVFGHAVLEAMAIGSPFPLVRALVIQPSECGALSDLAAVDRVLVKRLDGLRSPKELVPVTPHCLGGLLSSH